MTDEELIRIALGELTKPLYKYKEPDNISMPLDTGDNRIRYGWSLEDCQRYGQPYSSFLNLNVMPGVVAIGFKGPNPCLDDSCYNPRTKAILDLDPLDFDIQSLGLSIEQFERLKIDRIAERYLNYITRVVKEWLWDSEKDEYDFYISRADQQRIKQCFGAAIMNTIKNMETFYCPVVEKTISFVLCGNDSSKKNLLRRLLKRR